MPEPSAPAPLAPAADPTPSARCQVAASSDNPLVTEWPASEKSRLESLTTSQAVAVEYSGCELRIVDSCRLPGRYLWRRTTLATDTVDIANADELYAKLPLGAVSLEGELERSGQLAVRTTVVGQMQMVDFDERRAGTSRACVNATHVINAISIGAFKLLSGQNVAGGGEVGVSGFGGESRSEHSESVVKQAGMHDVCPEATDEKPHSQCASPIQVFLKPLGQEKALNDAESARTQGAVHVSFAAPEDPDERWTLRSKGGDPLCSVPCSHWIGPASGYYLQREKMNGSDLAVVSLPDAFPFKPGTRVSATYQAERGMPTLASLTWWGVGLPSAALAGVLTAFGTVQAISGTECDDFGSSCPILGSPGANFAGAAFYGVAAGAALWWYLYSQDEQINTFEGAVPPSAKRSGVRIMVGPTGVRGTF